MFNKPFYSQNHRNAAFVKGSICALFVLICSLISSIGLFAQATDTEIDSIPGTSSYYLKYETTASPLPCYSEVGFYVVVSPSSSSAPTLELEVPAVSWLFDSDSTDLEVGTPIVVGTSYKFPISAIRQDGVAQAGTGIYLRLNLAGGIVIAVEDFPTKTRVGVLPEVEGPRWSADETFSFSSPNKVKQVRLLNLSGDVLGVWLFSKTGRAEGQLPLRGNAGIYLFEITYFDGRQEVLKLFR